MKYKVFQFSKFTSDLRFRRSREFLVELVFVNSNDRQTDTVRFVLSFACRKLTYSMKRTRPEDESVHRVGRLVRFGNRLVNNAR